MRFGFQKLERKFTNLKLAADEINLTFKIVAEYYSTSITVYYSTSITVYYSTSITVYYSTSITVYYSTSITVYYSTSITVYYSTSTNLTMSWNCGSFITSIACQIFSFLCLKNE